MSMAWSERRIPVPPLDQLQALEVACDPCGRGRRLEEEALSGLAERGYQRMEDVRGKLVCAACGERHRLSLIPVFKRTIVGAREIRAT